MTSFFCCNFASSTSILAWLASATTWIESAVRKSSQEDITLNVFCAGHGAF